MLDPVIRKSKPGVSELGGLTRVFAYQVEQFRSDFEFPWRGAARVYPCHFLYEYPDMTKLMSFNGIEYYNITLGGMFPVILMKRLSDTKYMLGSVEHCIPVFIAATKFANFNTNDLGHFMGYLDIEQILPDLGLNYSYMRNFGQEVGAWQAAVPASDVLSVPSGLSGNIIKLNQQLRHIYFKNTGLLYPDGLPKASRIVFDVKESEWKSTGNASNTQFSQLHGLVGKVAGYHKEKNATVDSYVGKDLVLVAQRANGDMAMLGTTFKPMRMKISSGTGKAADDYVGSDIEFFQTDAVDFAPPILADFLKPFIVGPVPAYV